MIHTSFHQNTFLQLPECSTYFSCINHICWRKTSVTTFSPFFHHKRGTSDIHTDPTVRLFVGNCGFPVTVAVDISVHREVTKHRARLQVGPLYPNLLFPKLAFCPNYSQNHISITVLFCTLKWKFTKSKDVHCLFGLNGTHLYL